jgi:hypothetical protein
MDITVDGTKPTPVFFASIQEPLEQMNGSVRPQRVTAAFQDTSIITIDSSLRKTGTNYNFVADLMQSNASYRQIKLTRAVLPIIPQINEANNTVRVRLDGVALTKTFTLDPGYYTPETLANEMSDKFGALWTTEGETVTITYYALTRTIEIDSSVDFGILDSCPFALYGRNVVQFPTVTESEVLSQQLITSLSLSMVFTRWIQIESVEMLSNQRGANIVAGKGALSIIGIADVIGSYNTAQWNPAQVFPGTSESFQINVSPRVNFQKSLSTPRTVDITIKDEFSFPLDRIGAISYPVTLWFEVYL